jgi:hypothetical protein
MAYRVPAIEIPEDNPYKNDVLQRDKVASFLTGLIERAGGPFVLALDSPYGTGKSTLVEMLRVVLSARDYQCIYFNAWQVDYISDPLVAMVSALDKITRGSDEKYAGMKTHMSTLRRVTTSVAKRSVVAAAKAATMGLLDLDEAIEGVAADLIGESTLDLVEAFQRESEQLIKFKDELQAVVNELPATGKKKTLVFFVDELDRCRPTFAIELLERIKHLFEVSNICFVLSVDMRQLQASVASVYGNGIDAPEYLRKFIDLEYGLPQISGDAFTNVLLTKFGLDTVFARRSGRETQNDRQNFVRTFSKLADLFGIGLRTRERCIVRLKVVLDQTPDDHYLDPIHVALLIVLRIKQQTLFAALANGSASSDDVMDCLTNQPGGQDFVFDRIGIVLESYLIESDTNHERRSAAIARISAQMNSEDLTEKQRSRYIDLHRMTSNERYGMRMSSPSIANIAAKIDIAAYIRD